MTLLEWEGGLGDVEGSFPHQLFCVSKNLFFVFQYSKNIKDLKSTAAPKLALLVKRTYTPITAFKNLNTTVIGDT